MVGEDVLEKHKVYFVQIFIFCSHLFFETGNVERSCEEEVS